MKAIHWVFLGTIAAVVLAMGCATTGQSTSTAASGSHPKFEEMCSKCHTLDRVHVAHNALSQQQMSSIVQRMSHKPGSNIDPNSIEDIVSQIY
ncbi:MAG: hypothetical protein P9L94_16175 [Candidatus Hinthialibacter antarcticus]|nr:hypothetical protein [Candidatus Hinthialibacter antarcticus]